MRPILNLCEGSAKPISNPLIMLKQDDLPADRINRSQTLNGIWDMQTEAYTTLTHLRHGEELFEKGELDQAEKQFQAVLRDNPENAIALNNLGVIAHSRGQCEAAIALLTRALVKDPNYLDAAANLTPILEQIPRKKLSSVGRYALPMILSRLGMGVWEESDNEFVTLSAANLDQNQLEVILGSLVQSPTQEDFKPITIIIGAITELSNGLLRTIGTWLSTTTLSRRQRDELEQLICLKGRDDELVREIAKREGYYRSGSFPAGWERYPRRVLAPVCADNPFMKEVPAGAPSKQGGMRVLIVSDFNIAGQCTALMRALNKYTNHMARCVVVQDDYLSYDRDVLITNQQGVSSPEAVEEACKLIPQADFFHFGRGLFTFPGIDWNRYLSPRNCVFQYYGSELRDNGDRVAQFHAVTQFQAITAVDLTMYRLLPASYYHIQPYMLEMDQLPQVDWNDSSTIRICHAPSSANYRKVKQTDLLLEVMNRMARERKNVEPVLIENMTNGECLKAKSRCHIHIAHLLPAFGLNAIESAAMGLVPICGVGNFSRLIYPESPVPNASAKNLYAVVKDLVDNPAKARETGLACREWARPLFDARNLVQKYWYLYDVIYNGLSVDYPDIFGH